MINHNSIMKYPSECAQLFDKAKDGFTIREFMEQIELLTYEKVHSGELTIDEGWTFKGDLLEILSEIFFNLFSNDPCLGLRNYKPIGKSEDLGVDAVGINVNGDNCVVQVKYRKNPEAQILWSQLAKTAALGVFYYNIDPTKNNTIFVFTTAKDTNHICHSALPRKIVSINRKMIAKMIDNNKNFWVNSYDLIKEHIEFYTKKDIGEFI